MFRRATSMPASTRRRTASAESTAGPSVHTILALCTSFNLAPVGSFQAFSPDLDKHDPVGDRGAFSPEEPDPATPGGGRRVAQRSGQQAGVREVTGPRVEPPHRPGLAV